MGCGDYLRAQRSPDNFAARAGACSPKRVTRAAKGCPPLPLQILNDIREPKLAEALQAMWRRELGVNISIEPYEQKTFFKTSGKNMTHTFAFSGWVADFADPVTFLNLFTTGNGNNFGPAGPISPMTS